MTTPLPGAGDVVQVTRAASVQFAKPIMFRVIRVLDRPTYDRWVWLDGYQLDKKGDAVVRREIFVQPAGLRVQRPTPAPRRPTQPTTITRVRRDRRTGGPLSTSQRRSAAGTPDQG